MSDVAMNICAHCGKDYDPSEFGAGTKYCKSACKWAARGTPLGGRSPGRPRRFPKGDALFKQTVTGFLRARGWRVVDFPDEDFPMRLKATKGWFSVRLCIGGGYRDELWADVVAYNDAEWKKVMWASTCRREKREVHVKSASSKKTTMRLHRTACNKEACGKCAKAAWMKRLIALDSE